MSLSSRGRRGAGVPCTRRFYACRGGGDRGICFLVFALAGAPPLVLLSALARGPEKAGGSFVAQVSAAACFWRRRRPEAFPVPSVVAILHDARIKAVIPRSPSRTLLCVILLGRPRNLSHAGAAKPRCNQEGALSLEGSAFEGNAFRGFADVRNRVPPCAPLRTAGAVHGSII